jgi:hypothetical protein
MLNMKDPKQRRGWVSGWSNIWYQKNYYFISEGCRKESRGVPARRTHEDPRPAIIYTLCVSAYISYFY